MVHETPGGDARGLVPLPAPDTYAWHHLCPQCDAAPGEPCRAPRGQAGPCRPEPYGFMHGRRSDAGYRHYQRDHGAAPWPEERRPRVRYDSLPLTLLAPPDPQS